MSQKSEKKSIHQFIKEHRNQLKFMFNVNEKGLAKEIYNLLTFYNKESEYDLMQIYDNSFIENQETVFKFLEIMIVLNMSANIEKNDLIIQNTLLNDEIERLKKGK